MRRRAYTVVEDGQISTGQICISWRSRRTEEARDEKQRRKAEHLAELDRRGEGDPDMDPLSPALTEAWAGWYFDGSRTGPPHRTVQRLTLGIPVVLRLDAARLP